MMQDNSLGGRIKEKRKELGLSQEELVEALGIKQCTLSKYENGSAIPSDTIVEMARVLHTTPDYLLLGKEDKNSFLSEIINIAKNIDDINFQEIALKQMKVLADINSNM
jgi:transcriptional regulator with XRE-family HTH domain